jgi:hypothetical protein
MVVASATHQQPHKGVPLREPQRMALFCDRDDFCKRFPPLSHRPLLQSGQRQRSRQTELARSEIMTSLVNFPWSHYRTCTHSSTESVQRHLRPYLPTLVRATRFVELLPRALVP